MRRFQVQQHDSAPTMFRSQPMQQNLSGPTGGSGDGGSGAEQTAADEAAKAAEAEAAAKSGENLPDDPAALKAEIEKLRRENASSRVAGKTAAAKEAAEAARADILKALGITTDETDPAKIAAAKAVEDAAKAEKAEAAGRALALENAILRLAPKAGANADTLLDSRAFLTAVKDTDPTDAKAVTAAITAAVKDNPRFKLVAQAAGTSGADFSGGSGEGPKHPAHNAQAGLARVAAAFATPQ